MKGKSFLKLSAVFVCLPLFLAGCNNQPQIGPQGEQGEQGEPGERGYSVLTGHGEPSNDEGRIGDCYIDLDTWNYYVKCETGWVLSGNIRGEKGDTGTSIVSTEIDENGDLIVTFSNGEVINVGHIKDMDEYVVNFYLDDLFVGSKTVKNGEKVTPPDVENFKIYRWFIDKELQHEWLPYGCFVTENMTLYGEYTPIYSSVLFNNDLNISIDENGYGEVSKDNKKLCVSKALSTTENLTILESRGILFNTCEMGYLGPISIKIGSNSFESAKIYYGNNPLSFEHSKDLNLGYNRVDLSGAYFFTIQNTGNSNITIDAIEISYGTKTKFIEANLPTITINTENEEEVTSRTEYVDCEVSTEGAKKDFENLKAQIKVRGNSTALCPKKPYRIKLNKKQSLFGYEKAKNWVLLADYMDGSRMHNYTALKFAKMIREEESFGVNPLHVNVVLNGVNLGLYLFGEHIDAKEGRLNIEQDRIWEKEFNEINFYIERDAKTLTDPSEIEGETYFVINMEDYNPNQYVFALKYPEKDDFEEELEDGTVDAHEDEFESFFNNLKTYMTGICNKFKAYQSDKNEFASISQSVDVQSLAKYGVIDQAFSETDHNLYSYKMYRANGGLLKFGPNWDYDSCAYGLPYQGHTVLNPFSVGTTTFKNLYISDKWSYMLYNDLTNGRVLFKKIWENITIKMIDDFINEQLTEISNLSFYLIDECELWMDSLSYSVFDNLLYHWEYLNTQLNYLKSFYF